VNWLSQVADPANLGLFITQFEADLQTAGFWLALGKIVWINVLLSGDNALVIALACRGLHGRRRLWGMVAGSGIAVALRILFTGIVVTLMALPYLKLVGGLALLVIAAKLLVPEDENDDIAAGTTLWHAIRIVVLADIVMSLDNVIAVAAAANGQASLLILGLAMSIPLIIAGAALIILVLDRFPILVWLGAMLLGWIAGEVIATDLAIEPMLHWVLDGSVVINIDAASALLGGKTHLGSTVDVMETLASLLGAVIVLIAGSIWRSRTLRRQAKQGAAAAVPARGIDLP
jgi:YjbE family integral membrane protein